MKNEKLETISNLFEGKEIRSIWDAEKEEYFFSVVDVIGALTDSKIAKEGGEVAKTAREDLEKKLGETVISKKNVLNYKYMEQKVLEEMKDTKKDDEKKA